MVHPRVGRLRMDCETLVTPDQGQELVVLTPADDEARERLELLLVLGSRSGPRLRRTGRSGTAAGDQPSFLKKKLQSWSSPAGSAA
jgi:hypothetical protein